MAKASDHNGCDAEERNPGAQTGLDTPVVQGVNAADLVLGIYEDVQCWREGIKSAAWGVRSQD